MNLPTELLIAERVSAAYSFPQLQLSAQIQLSTMGGTVPAATAPGARVSNADQQLLNNQMMQQRHIGEMMRRLQQEGGIQQQQHNQALQHAYLQALAAQQQNVLQQGQLRAPGDANR